MNSYPLKKFADYVSEKISTNELNVSDYVTTDNILQNKQGITLASSLPAQSGKVTKYRTGDILLANIRPYLKKIWFSQKTGGCSADVLVFRAKENINPIFLYYALFRDDFFNHVMNGAKGTKMPRGDKTQIMEFSIPEFDKNIQNKIAQTLSCLDKKIELNNRINAELAAMAKTLYDYWFVQFDFPDANGKPYKTAGGKMVYNPTLKREIPDGWIVEPLTKSCDVIDCLHSKKPDLHHESDDCYLLQLENITDYRQINPEQKYFVSKQDYLEWTSRIEVKHFDIVMTNAGRIAAFAQIPKGTKCGIGRNITAIRPKDIKPNYFYMSLSGNDIQKQIFSNLDHGAFFKSFNVKGIKKLHLTRPGGYIESKFEELISPIIEKRNAVVAENAKLASLRDWLLPMLMNGQVNVN